MFFFSMVFSRCFRGFLENPWDFPGVGLVSGEGFLRKLLKAGLEGL